MKFHTEDDLAFSDFALNTNLYSLFWVSLTFSAL